MRLPSATQLSLWLPAALQMAAIFLVSSLSNPATLMPGGVSDSGGHFVGYVLLSVLLLRALAGGRVSGITWRTALLAAAAATLYGVSDEIHQHFVPGRTPDLQDVLTDAIGGGTGAILGLLLRAVRPQPGRDTSTVALSVRRRARRPRYTAVFEAASGPARPPPASRAVPSLMTAHTLDNLEHLIVDRQGPVAIVTVHRPRVLNALASGTLDELRRVMVAFRDDDAVRVVVVTGSGEKAFVAGADINELAAQSPARVRRARARRPARLRLIENLGKPVIAAINGFALGGGCELAMACTLRLAAETARLGQPEINLGLMPG